MESEKARSTGWRLWLGRVAAMGVVALALQATGCDADRASGPAIPRRVAANIDDGNSSDRGGNSNDAHRGQILSATFVRVVPRSVAAEMIGTFKAGEAFTARYKVAQWKIAYTTI